MEPATGKLSAFWRVVTAVGVSTWLVACGGDGSSNLNPPNFSGGGTAATGLQLFVVRDAATNGTTTELRAVNWGANPPTNVAVDNIAPIGSNSGIREYLVADGSPAAYTNWRKDLAIYNRGDGTLYRVELQLTGTPVTRRVSSQTGDPICNVYHTNAAFGGRAQMWYAYEVSGAGIGDADCNTPNDNVWRLVRAEMGASDTPIAMYPPVTEIINTDHTQIVGWLVMNGTNLQRYDATMGVPAAASIDVGNVTVSHLGTSSSERIALRIGNGLRVFNAAGNSLSAPYFTFVSPIAANTRPYASDATDLYFVDNGNLYRFALDAPATPLQIGSETIDMSRLLHLTPTRVVFVTTSGAIKSLPKNGDNSTLATPLVTPLANEVLVVYAVDSTQVAFNGVTTTVPNAYRAGVTSDTGTGLVAFSGYGWVAAPLASTGSAHVPRYEGLLRSAIDGTNLQAGQPLASYDINGNLLFNLGNVPSDIRVLSAGNVHVGSKILLTGTGPATGGGAQKDLFRVDLRAGNSLARVTDTNNSGVNEEDFLWQ